jgi:hypothetical protein
MAGENLFERTMKGRYDSREHVGEMRSGLQEDLSFFERFLDELVLFCAEDGRRRRAHS